MSKGQLAFIPLASVVVALTFMRLPESVDAIARAQIGVLAFFIVLGGIGLIGSLDRADDRWRERRAGHEKAREELARRLGASLKKVWRGR